MVHILLCVKMLRLPLAQESFACAGPGNEADRLYPGLLYCALLSKLRRKKKNETSAPSTPWLYLGDHCFVLLWMLHVSTFSIQLSDLFNFHVTDLWDLPPTVDSWICFSTGTVITKCGTSNSEALRLWHEARCHPCTCRVPNHVINDEIIWWRICQTVVERGEPTTAAT